MYLIAKLNQNIWLNYHWKTPLYEGAIEQYKFTEKKERHVSARKGSKA